MSQKWKSSKFQEYPNASQNIQAEKLNEKHIESFNLYEEIRPPTVGQEFKESFKEENAGDSATPPSLMVSGKPFPPKVASWDSKHMNHTPTMQPTNVTGVRGGPPPALPPKPTKPRNTGIGFPSGRVAPISEPVPLVSGSSTKPNVLLPPKSDQVLAQSVRLMNSPAHSSASRTNSNNSGASGSAASALSNKTSSDNCAQSQKSSSSEIVQHHTTRVGTSDSSKSPETMSEPTGNTTLDSTLKAESLTKLTTDSENVHENQKDNSDSNRNSPALLPPIVSDPQVVTGRKVGDIANEKFILSQSTHGSTKSINSFDDKKLESPLRNSESERGRGFEPEGSIDLSPTTYSETSAHTTQSSSIQSSPPSYFLWQESLQSLIDDAEGIELFEEFLKEMDLLYLLKFLKTVAGMKKEILSGYGTTENRSDPSTWELEILELREQKFKFYQKSLSAVNKAFINTNMKNRYQQLPEELGGKPVLDAQTKSTINSKIEAIKQTFNECTTSCIPGSSPNCRYHVPIDGNIFDGVQNNVYECLEQKPYYKFFESQIYIDHVNDVNEQRNLQLESEDNASQNRQMIVSGEQSSGSSISKNMQSGNTTLTVDTTQIDSVPLTSITSATSDRTKDSGFSATSLVGGSSSDKSLSSVSKHGPIAQSGPQPSISSSESVLEQSSHQSKSASDLLSISHTSALGSSQLSTSVIHQNTIVGEPLPAIEEDRELKFSKHNAPSTFLPNTDFSDSSSSSKFKQKGSDGIQRSEAPYINKDNELPLLSSSFNSSRSYSTHGKRANNSYFQESYPSTSVPDSIGVDSSRSQGFRGGNYRGQSKPSLTKPSYAYHTNEAFASSYYPVSKQNSEVQSQSSGALGGGDTTDDNYSTFTDPSPYQPTDPRTGRVSKSSSDIHRMPGNMGQKFTPYNKNPQIAAIGGGRSSEPTHAGNRHASRHEYKSLKYEERRNEKTKKKIAEDHINRGNREQPQTITTKPPNKAPAPNGTLAESKPAEFADLLIGKLNAVLKIQEKEEESSKKLDHKLKTMEAESSVASFPPAAFVNQRLLLNRSRSAANDPNEESDQSILDDHVARNFPNTPPVPRSPPNASSMRSRSSKASGAGRSSRSTGSGQTTKTLHHQSFDSRMGPHASFGHQTLPSRSNATGSHQSASAFGSSRGAMHQSFGGPSQSGNVSGYGSTLPEQDLVYYPDSRAHQASRNRPRHPGSAPFSDTGFPISSNNPINAFSARQPNQSQPISYGSEERTKHIENWVQNSAQIAAQPAGRRSKSQTREGHSEGAFNIDPMSTHAGRYGPGHHQSFQSHPHHAGSQIGSVQPHELTTRLQQVHRMGNQGFGNTSLMAPNHHSGNVNMNISLPVSGSRDDSMQGFRQAASGQNNFIVALYSFPQEKEDTPYRIKIPFFGPTNTVTLHMVKDHMPKKGNNYRFYFKCKIDGDVCFEEVTDNNAHVPTNDGKIVVQCRA